MEEDGNGIRVRGHRGAAALAPENTVSSFRCSVAADVYSVEFDVRLSADAEPVVIHDETVDRTTDGTGPVTDYTADELQDLDAGDGEHVPTLRETLDYLAGTDVPEFRIELKEQTAVEPVYELVTASGVQDRTVYHSFDKSMLQDITDLNEDASTSLAVFEPYDGLLSDVNDLGCDVIAIRYDNASAAYIDTVQQSGIKADIWGVEGEDAIYDAVSCAPTYIGAENPVRAYDVLEDT